MGVVREGKEQDQNILHTILKINNCKNKIYLNNQ